MGWSGKTGKVYAIAAIRSATGGWNASTPSTEVAEVVGWNADGKFRVHTYGHSDSDGFQDALAGTGSVTGDIEVKLQSGLTLSPGLAYGVKLENAAVTLSGIAMIESIPVATRIDGGDPVSATYRFQSHGAWTFGAGTGTDTP